METREKIVQRIQQDRCYSVPMLARKGLDYSQRETLKREARAVLASDAPLPSRAWALLHWIESHDWRAKEAIEARPTRKQQMIHGKRWHPGYQLDIDVYTWHWLWANGDKVKEQDAVRYVRDTFGYKPEQSLHLPKGRSCYVF